MVSRVPTEADWRSEPWDLDIPHAYKHFAGRTFEQAVGLFKEHALYYQEDVMFMPRACFPFYARAYMAYLMSVDSRGDADGASCFFGLAKCRAQDINKDEALVHAFIDCLEHLAQRQEFYDADVSIYGSFAERARQILHRLRGQHDGPD